MRVTRRGLFAMIVAAIVGKPAVKVGISLAEMRSWDPVICNCPSCQWVRGSLGQGNYDWYQAYAPEKLRFHTNAFALVYPKIGDTITIQRPKRS